jgi:hypothetical protein
VRSGATNVPVLLSTKSPHNTKRLQHGFDRALGTSEEALGGFCSGLTAGGR